MFSSKNVLVTGGAGFIGTNLIQRLINEGANVRATLHSKSPNIITSKLQYIKGDLQNHEFCCEACRDIDYVFLCAANTSGAAVMEKTPLVHLTPNIIMNSLMLEAAYAAGVHKLLFISSNTVYPVTDYPVVETDVINQFYEKYFIVAWMKRFSEIMCEMYATKIKKPMHTVIVRPANVYGPYDDFEWETSHVLPALIRKVIERHDPINVWGDGLDIKDFIYVDDVVNGLLLAMEKISNYDVVNIASGNQYQLRDILQMIINIDGYANSKIVFDATKPTMIPKRLISPAKAKKLLGFEPMISMEVGLKKTIEWYRNNNS